MLYNISTTLKRQGKLSSEEEKVQKLRPAVVKYAEYWTEENDSMFPKMHQLLEHVLSFLDCHGMLGQVNEEGMEAKHPQVHAICEFTKGIVDTKERARKMFERLSLGLNDEYDRNITHLKENRKMDRDSDNYNRPRQCKRGLNTTKQTDTVELDSDQEGEDNNKLPENLARTVNNRVVHKEWKETYDYIVASRVPLYWRQAFVDDDTLGSVPKLKAEFIN